MKKKSEYSVYVYGALDVRLFLNKCLNVDSDQLLLILALKSQILIISEQSAGARAPRFSLKSSWMFERSKYLISKPFVFHDMKKYRIP